MSLIKEKVIPQPVVQPANRLAGKVALVTGGTRGIGLAVAKAYAREGAKVVIASRTSGELKTALEELKALGGDVVATKIDLSSWEACSALIASTLRTYATIDILVNNAAILGPRQKIINYPVDAWDEVMKTNLNAVFWLSKAALGTMIPNNGGSIINVSSGVAEQGRAEWGAYAVSKAAVENFSEVLSDEVASFNIRVNCVDPGPTRTMMREEAYPKENPETLPKPEDVVNPFIYLACEASKGVTGSVFKSKDWIGRSF